MTAEPRPDRRLALWTGALTAVVCAVLYVLHLRGSIPTAAGRAIVGFEIGPVALAIQLAALALGIVLINSAPRRSARWILAGQGAICLLCYGAAGVGFLAIVVLWWVAVGSGRFGRLGVVFAALALAGVDACAFAGDQATITGRLFAMIFSLRLIVFTYDRWQHELARVELADYLTFALPAPLIIVPPYMAIISLFGGFATKFQPGLTPPRLWRVVRHLAWGAIWGGGLAVLLATHVEDRLAAPAAMYVHLLAGFAGLGAIGHALIALLLVHGIDERVPIDRPLLATRFAELWRRTSIHLKDAQVFLFYTPALLRFRRGNRYVAIVVATVWTMLVGNVVLHFVARYCFLSRSEHVAWGLAGNTVMAVALALDLCQAEWASRRHRRASPHRGYAVLGWIYTMTVAAIVSVL